MSDRNGTSVGAGGWDPVADWYAGWAGGRGSEHHRRVAIPAVLDLLEARRGERILDVGCGPAALAPHVSGVGARYSGIDLSRKLIAVARRDHGGHGRFAVGDATDPGVLRRLGWGPFHAAVFLLSIQDIDPLPAALRVVAAGLRPGGRLAILMTHPCFRVPRQSGWGWDPGRKLRFRRVDSYLTPNAAPMKRYGSGGRGATRSHHRPLQQYMEALADAGFLVERLRELTGPEGGGSGRLARAERRAHREIPLFLGIRAVLAS